MCSALCTEGGPATFEHQATLYRGVDELVASVVPFVRDGLARGEPVLVALPSDRLTAVEAGLGPDAVRVDFIDMEELGANPARIIPEWRRFLTDVGREQPVRGVGEPVWAGRRDVELSEAALHEALLNLAFADGPGWQLMCPYDISALPRAVVDEAVRNHPIVPGYSGTGTYAGHRHAISQFSTLLPTPPDAADLLDFGPGDLAGLRRIVATLAQGVGLAAAAVDDLVLAVHEVATNSIVHGGGRGRLQAWTEPGAFVAQVSDTGVIEDPLVGRDELREFTESGRGIWMANQLCDLVQVRSGPQGTVVRLFAWL